MNKHPVVRSESSKEVQADVVNELRPSSPTVIKTTKSEDSCQVIVKGKTVALRRRILRISETVDFIDTDAENLLRSYFKIDDDIGDLEEVA